MNAKSINPGNLHVRLGAALQLYETAVFQGDLATASSMLGIITTYCSVHMKASEMAKVEGMPGFAYDDARAPHEIFRDMNRRLAYVLATVKDHGVFSRAELELGDASSLDQEDEVVA